MNLGLKFDYRLSIPLSSIPAETLKKKKKSTKYLSIFPAFKILD